MSPARPRVGWRSGLTPSCVRAMLARRPASRRWRSTGGAARCAWCVRRGTRNASTKYPRRYFRPQGVAAGALRLAGRARSALAVGHGPPAEPRPARRADHFVLKGHLKNVQVAYIRVAALLAKVRDEKLYRALGHATMDD